MGNIGAGTLMKFTKLLIANVSPGILQEFPVSSSISRGLLWLQGASSWLDVEMLTATLTDLGRSLPDFLLVVP